MDIKRTAAYRIACGVFKQENGRGPWMPSEQDECAEMAARWLATGQLQS